MEALRLKGHIAQWAREHDLPFYIAYQRYARKGSFEARPYHYPTTADIRRFVTLHHDGLSTYRIAKATGFNRITIRRHLIAAGVYQPKPVGRPVREKGR